MILSILAAILIAKLKKQKISVIFKAYELYPLFAVELVYWFFEFNSFFGNYYYIKFAPFISKAFLLVLLVPIIKDKLYKPGILGSLLVFAGTVSNQVVIHANGGKMPVLNTLTKITGYYKEGMLDSGLDNLHIKLIPGVTHLNFLADYIDIGWCVLSIGDVLIHSFVAIIVYYTIKELNIKKFE